MKHVPDAAHVQEAMATFKPDVILVSGDAAFLVNMSFERRKEALHVSPDASPLKIQKMVEECYSFNIWNKNQWAEQNPLMSVYTAAWDSGSYLEEAYSSLKAQTWPTWEWVVVDDCSSDQTWEQLTTWARKDARVKPIRLATHSGKIGELKDIATRQCRGDFLVELDHDDQLLPVALERIKDALQQHPEVGMVYGNLAEVLEDGSPRKRYAGPPWTKDSYREVEVAGRKYLECRIPDINGRFGPHFTDQFGWYLTVGPNHPRAFRTSTFHALGGYNPRLPVADDWDLTARFFLQSKCFHVDELLYVQRFRADGQNATFMRNQGIQDHLALGRGHYASAFRRHNQEVLGTKDDVAFVVASRRGKDAEAMRKQLKDHRVEVVEGASSIFQAYEWGRRRLEKFARIVYIHDDVEILRLEEFIAAVRTAQPGLHGVCGASAPDALNCLKFWWEHPAPVGAVVAHGDSFTWNPVASRASWLDGLCLVTVDQQWSWLLHGDPPLWHGYDWLACTRAEGCWTLPQSNGPLLAHASRAADVPQLREALACVRAAARPLDQRVDWPNIKEHLERLRAEAAFLSMGAVILELGTREGISTAALLEGASFCDGTVYSVDCDSKCAEVWRGHPRWQFRCADSADVERVGLKKKIDLLWIDSAHTFGHTCAELRAWLPRMKKSGVVLMHDLVSFPDVHRAIRTTVPKFGWKLVEFLKHGHGLGVLRRTA